MKPKGETSEVSGTCFSFFSVILILAVDVSGFGTRSTGKQRDSFPSTYAELEIHTKIDELDLDEREFLAPSVHVKSITQY